MTAARLVVAGLRHYWRTNLAVIVGVATAVAVLAGALLVGDSVRGSLRDLVLQRLGRVDWTVVSSGFFREALADDLRTDRDFAASFGDLCPIVMVPGVVTDQATGRRSSQVQVYGVDDRFWRFQRRENRTGPDARGAFISTALAADVGATGDGTIVVPSRASVDDSDRVAARSQGSVGPNPPAYRTCSAQRAGPRGLLAAAAAGRCARDIRPTERAPAPARSGLGRERVAGVAPARVGAATSQRF